MIRPLSSATLALSLLLVATTALADRVANVHARGDAKSEDRARVERAAGDAIAGLGHTSPTSKEVVDGEAAAGDLVGTSAGLVAIGKTTSSDWVVEAFVTPTPGGLHVDLKACQVATGRVETASRDLDLRLDVAAQLREMLGLLLRPQGIADDPIPWLGATPAKTPTAPPTATPPVPTPGAPATPPAAPPQYGRAGSVFVGVGGGAYDVVSRPARASGGHALGAFAINFGYGLPSMQRLELVGAIGGYFGPAGAIRVELGARYMFPLSRAFAIGAAADVGALAATSDSKTVRFVAGVNPVLALTISPKFQLDFTVPAVRWAPGGDGSLVFLGGEASLIVRL